MRGNTVGHTAVSVAPGAHKKKVLLGGVLYGLEEVHRVRAARLRVASGNLIQELYETPPQDQPSHVRVLARNIVGTWLSLSGRFSVQPVSIKASVMFGVTILPCLQSEAIVLILYLRASL